MLRRGPAGEIREGTGHGEHLRHRNTVVEGAVVDHIAGLVGLADAEVIVVGGQDHDLVAELGVGAPEDAGDIAGGVGMDIHREIDGGGHSQRDRLKVARSSGLDERLEVVAAECGKGFRTLPGQPTVEQRARLVTGDEFELLADVGRAHHLPRVTGGLGGVDDDGAGGALTRGAGVLVVPPAVGELAITGEERRVPVGVIVEHEQDLPREIRSLEIVPAFLGCDNAVTDKDHFGVGDGNPGLLDTGHQHVLVGEAVCSLGAVRAFEGPAFRRIRGQPDNLYRLLVRSAVEEGLEPHLGQPAGEIGSGQPISFAARPAPAELIARQHADVGQQVPLDDGFRRAAESGRELEVDLPRCGIRRGRRGSATGGDDGNEQCDGESPHVTSLGRFRWAGRELTLIVGLRSEMSVAIQLISLGSLLNTTTSLCCDAGRPVPSDGNGSADSASMTDKSRLCSGFKTWSSEQLSAMALFSIRHLLSASPSGSAIVSWIEQSTSLGRAMTTPSTRSFRVCVLPAFLILTLFAATAAAEVERVEITSRETFAGGMAFGETGAYEKIRGTLFYAVDPANPANAAIVDIELAPRGADGMVRFQGDFLLLKPVDLSRGNGRLLYDVNNRGNLYMLRHINGGTRTNDPSTAEDAGNGFLMEEGYSLLWSAWNWDVVAGDDRLQIELPIATEGGEPIRQRIAAEIVVSFGREPESSMPLAWGSSRCYPALNPNDNSGAVLTVRDAPMAQRRTIPNNQWSFSRVENGVRAPDPTRIAVDGGLLPGKIYELIYEVQNPRVVGLGLAAVRDAMAFFHFEGEDRYGNPNPLAVGADDGQPTSAMDLAYIFGVSQSGRFIVHMLWQGFHVDEQERMVFDGARIHVAGGGKGGFNHRFAQTTHHPSHLEGNYFPADHPPFNFLPDGSPADNDVLAEAKRLGAVPKIIMMNNALEYWARSASLVHTDPTGTTDAALHPDVRYYMTNGAPHGGAATRARTITEHERNPLDVARVQRAMLVNLDRWVSDGVEPPPSRYPRIDRGELITASEHARRFPAIPGMRHPGRNLEPPRVDYGPDFWTTGVFTEVPPEMGEPYRTLVPAFDTDGNGVGGIRLPQLAVPLGTSQGWNPRAADFGAPEFLSRFDGSFWVFPTTEAQRAATADPRPSIDERYDGHQSYVDRVAAAAGELAADRILLDADAAAAVDFAGRLVWPPEILDAPPFWRVGDSLVLPNLEIASTTADAAPAPEAAAVATIAAGAILAAGEPTTSGTDPGATPKAPADTAVATAVAATAVSSAGGIQISAEPGLQIYFDGELVGTTSAREDGLFLTGVKRGRHTIRAEKAGFQPQSFEVDVLNRPVEVEVGKFIPVVAALPASATAAAPSAQEVGSLVVTSAPQNITVEIDGRVEEKTTPQLSIGGIPVGEHTISFKKDGYQTVTSVITIEPGAENTVHGDLKASKVEVVHLGMGSLQVRSKPVSCTIWFRDEIHDKAYDRFNLTKIPAGEYPMMVMIPGRKLTTTVLIVDGQRTTVEVSFMKGDDPFVITRVQK